MIGCGRRGHVGRCARDKAGAGPQQATPWARQARFRGAAGGAPLGAALPLTHPSLPLTQPSLLLTHLLPPHPPAPPAPWAPPSPPSPRPHLLHGLRLHVGGLQLLHSDVLTLGEEEGRPREGGRCAEAAGERVSWFRVCGGHSRRTARPPARRPAGPTTPPPAPLPPRPRPTWLSLKMFFLRSMIFSPPLAVSVPMSPVWNQPSASSTCDREDGGQGGPGVGWG
jgi:hypothetical protein